MTASPDEVMKLWSFLEVDPDRILELRALWPHGLPDAPRQRVVIEHFDAARLGVEGCQSAFVDAAVRLNDSGYNVYVVMNPVRRQAWKPGAGVQDADISTRRLLLVDIDRKVGTDRPATAEELERAAAAALRVRAFTSANGWGEHAAEVMSGNGVHLYFRLSDWPNDEPTKALVVSLLRTIADAVDDEHVQVDRRVGNASRITKVPGTVNRKGLASEGRPYRLAVVRDA